MDKEIKRLLKLASIPGFKLSSAEKALLDDWKAEQSPVETPKVEDLKAEIKAEAEAEKPKRKYTRRKKTTKKTDSEASEAESDSKGDNYAETTQNAVKEDEKTFGSIYNLEES